MRVIIIFALINFTRVSALYHPRVSSEFHEKRLLHEKFFQNNKVKNQPNFYDTQHNDTLNG